MFFKALKKHHKLRIDLQPNIFVFHFCKVNTTLAKVIRLSHRESKFVLSGNFVAALFPNIKVHILLEKLRDGRVNVDPPVELYFIHLALLLLTELLEYRLDVAAQLCIEAVAVHVVEY